MIIFIDKSTKYNWQDNKIQMAWLTSWLDSLVTFESSPQGSMAKRATNKKSINA